MRITKESLDHVAFVFGSFITCTAILFCSGLSMPQMALASIASSMTGSVARSVANSATEAQPQAKAIKPHAKLGEITSCLDPAQAELGFHPTDRLCTLSSLLYQERMARLDMDLILKSQHAIIIDDSIFRTNVPTAIAETNSETQGGIPEQMPSEPELLSISCNGAQPSLTEEDSVAVASGASNEEAFKLAAAQLLCEAVGARESEPSLQSPTFIAVSSLGL